MPLDKLFSPFTLGSIKLKNRIIMAPLTRNRASQPGDVPTEMNARYYSQRAGAGLIVSEATQISSQGKGYYAAPGIYSDEQEAGWKQIVDAVHAKQGKMALQLWHVGRVSHHLVQENNLQPVAPSAIRAEDTTAFVKKPDGSIGPIQADTPRALGIEELPGIVQQYIDAATRAKRAGFDMVEVHAANGYLLQQFMSTNTNHRTDAYGGGVDNRVRLVVEVLEAVAGVYGAERVGVRISPNFVGFDLKDAEPEESALYLAMHLQRLGIAYMHIAEPDWAGGKPLSDAFRQALRDAYDGAILVCGQYTAEKGEARLERHQADAIVFGRAFLANPDLVERFREGSSLNAPNEATFYGGGNEGYTDYPTLDGRTD